MTPGNDVTKSEQNSLRIRDRGKSNKPFRPSKSPIPFWISSLKLIPISTVESTYISGTILYRLIYVVNIDNKPPVIASIA